MAKYDLGDLVAAVSNLDTSAAAPEVRMIPIEDIIPNKANFYAIDKKALQPLADSIAMDGLHHYPLVMPHPSKEGKYQLIDGERRYTAIKLLVEDKEHPRKDLRLVPCTVKQYKSAAMAELQLILSNSTNRVLSNAETMKQAQKMEILLYQLKEEGYEFPGRMRDQVAAACKVSAPKLARLKVIREKLISDFMYFFEKDKLPEQTAYALARLPVEFQSRISSVMGTAGLNGYAVERVLEKYKAGCMWDCKDLSCPDGKPCKRGDTFLRHDLESPYNMCGGETCCLKCSRARETYSPCERMCSKAKAKRKEIKDEREAKERKAQEARSREYEAATQRNAQRLLKAIDAAGLPDSAKFNWERYWEVVTVSRVREYAAGVFKQPLRSEELAPARLANPTALAELLGCTTDYLLGMSDDLTPVAYAANVEPEVPTQKTADSVEPIQNTGESVWIRMSDRPPKDGQVCFVIDGACDVEYARYEAGEWVEADCRICRCLLYDQEISYWMPAPALPEEVR